jgi:hypothetical protein
MTQTESPPKVRIGISNAESDDQLVMMVASGSQCDFHLISLAQARAVSLEIIKNVYQAELRNTLNISQPASRFAFRHRLRTQHQT